MPAFAFYFLACLMSVATVSSLKIQIPATVDHPDQQCILKGYLGACANLVTINAYADCKNIECAGPLRGRTTHHRAMSIGRAARGTHCDENKVCYDGECINIPRGYSMPEEEHENEYGFTCYRPNSAKPSSGSSG